MKQYVRGLEGSLERGVGDSEKENQVSPNPSPNANPALKENQVSPDRSLNPALALALTLTLTLTLTLGESSES